MGIQSDAIEKVLELAPPSLNILDGVTYSDRELYPIEAPLVSKFDVSTLGGLVDLLTAGVEGFLPDDYVLQVVDEQSVRVIHRISDKHGRREILVHADALSGLQKFTFNQYTSQEAFLIGVAAGFEPTDDREYLISIASTIDQKEKVNLADDGISQAVVVSKGIAMKQDTTLRNRLTLAPYRTFREVAQPASEFIFRAREGGQLALFEADGGAWKITAIHAVAEWLKNNLAGAGLGELPIIS
jgi:hypothetical protein